MRVYLKVLFLAVTLTLQLSPFALSSEETKMTKMEKPEAEWKKNLSPEQYHVLREKGTEQAFTGKYYNHHGKGIYKCAACGAKLFTSDTKFDSGTGWPSFWAPVSPEAIAYEKDGGFGMQRTEVHCPVCGGHMGHVFDDGPQPTGKRYCINSASLKFEEAVPMPGQKNKMS